MELNYQGNPSNKHHTFGMKLDPPPKKEGSFNDPPVLIQTFQKYTKKRLRCEIPETPLPTPSEL